jgi:hypothetical protein
MMVFTTAMRKGSTAEEQTAIPALHAMIISRMVMRRE